MRWERSGKTISKDSTIIEYHIIGHSHPEFTIESRKVKIAHSNGEGFWNHTSYFVIYEGKEKEFWSLSDAKEAVEKIIEKNKEHTV